MTLDVSPEIRAILDGHPVLLFDGVCNLCAGSVQWVIKRDKDCVIRFASLQSKLGQELLHAAGIDEHLDSMVFFEGDRVSLRSTAALRMLKRLPFPWKLGYPFIIVPPFLRDAIYSFIAKRRYRWFGKTETCMIPTPQLRERFLDTEPAA
ncbi:MAG: thiol-disulfide oxidoreductase DCC family protein [Planctomycetota bacterium]